MNLRILLTCILVHLALPYIEHISYSCKCFHLAVWAQVHLSYLAEPVSQDPKPSRGGYAIALVISIHGKKKDTSNHHLHHPSIQDAGTAKSVLTAFACTEEYVAVAVLDKRLEPTALYPNTLNINPLC